jgi:two-component system NtrC family sensor kinase
MKVESLIFDQTDFIVFGLDLTGRFIAMNAAAERLFNPGKKDLAGQPFHAVLDSYSYSKADQMINLTLQNGSVRDWELDHCQPDAEPVLVGYTTCILRDGNGNPVGIGAVGHDLTDKMELTAQLASTNQELEGALLQLEKAHAGLKSTQAQLLQSEKMRALGQMVAGVAHEINNPLGFARNNLIFLEEKLTVLKSLYFEYATLKNTASPDALHSIRQAEQKSGIFTLWDDLGDSIQESLEGIHRIQEIVLSLRNFSRLDEAENKRADINEGLRNTVQLVRPMCKDQIILEEAYGTIPQIFCHPGELNQVFLNLLTNAIQAIEGQGKISISTILRDAAITVQIKDSGKGMYPQILSKLGEPFFTTKPVGTGVGLGLAVSFGIIQRHNGKIRFESTPGEGTTAIVELPLRS